MTLLSLITFFTTMFVIVVIPGPGTFAIISTSLSNNLKSVSFIILGMIIADIIFLLFAIFGLNAIASILGELFVIVKYLGAIYLLYLGYKLLTSKEHTEDIKEQKSLSWKKSFLLGFAITFSNPQVVLFYLSLLPALVNIQTLSIVDMGLLCLAVTLVISIVMFGYAYLAYRAKKLIKNKNTKKYMNRTAGAVMIGASGALVAKG